MNTSINYNELRKLAAKAEKSRPILGSLLIKDGKAYFTDGIYLVVMNGYRGTPDMVINLNNYSTPIGEYPNLEMIMGGPFTPREFEQAIYGDGLIQQWKRQDGRIVYIDEAIKSQISKLVTKKGFAFDIRQVKTNQSVGLYEIDDDTKIYFGMKRREVEKNV